MLGERHFSRSLSLPARPLAARIAGVREKRHRRHPRRPCCRQPRRPAGIVNTGCRQAHRLLPARSLPAFRRPQPPRRRPAVPAGSMPAACRHPASRSAADLPPDWSNPRRDGRILTGSGRCLHPAVVPLRLCTRRAPQTSYLGLRRRQARRAPGHRRRSPRPDDAFHRRPISQALVSLSPSLIPHRTPRPRVMPRSDIPDRAALRRTPRLPIL